MNQGCGLNNLQGMTLESRANGSCNNYFLLRQLATESLLEEGYGSI